MTLFARIVSNDTDFTGIKAVVTIPDKWTVPDYGDFINFYIGFADYEEAGISYSYKYGSWHYFANPGLTTTPFSKQPNPGDAINLMLVNDGKGYISFWVNGYLKVDHYPVKLSNGNPLPDTTTVKMVCAASDCPPDRDDVTHSQVNWSDVQVLINGKWVNWDSNIKYTTKRDQSNRYTIQQDLPLEVTLSK